MLADVWSADDRYGIDARFLDAVDAGMKVGSPGAAAEVVTVASFTTKTTWVDERSIGWSIADPLHDLSPFSSPGPLRSGARKPDLTVPGNRLVAARSSSSTPPLDERITSAHRILSGTSMATPVVTGVVALMLELDPTLDPAGIKRRLDGACAIPAGATGGANDWGAGLLDCSRLP